MPYYAVAEGYCTGIYRYWNECEFHVSGFPEADYRKFHCYDDAKYFLRRRGLASHEIDNDCGLHSEDEGEDEVYYAVSVGHNPGIYTSLSQCRQQVDGYSEAEFRKFNCRKDAKYFMDRRGVPISGVNNNKNKNMNFNYNKQQRVKIYVDGACSRNGAPDAKAGLGVWFNNNHPLNVSKPIHGKKLTNIIAETMAVTEACKIAKKNNLKRITIYTDSKYVTDCVLEHLDTWISRGWRNSAGYEVGNRKILEDLDRAMDGLDVDFEDVHAHTGVYGNEKADHLARHAAGEF